ncbi:MAG TPA: vitamin K epoxide reductase family protein [Pyrinomonadaceae bacterium]|nr:vitamin K epoxide reductase family protein [Pyrinomonadaceae bacterium]
MPGTGDSSRKIVWLYLIAAIISLIGLGDAIYLTIQDLTGESLRCTIISGCSEVLSSKYAHLGSIPLASVGAAAYFVFFSLAILAAFGYGFVRPILLILVSFMFFTTLWLLYLQAFVIRHFCQYCLLSAAVTITLTVLIVIASRKARA